MKYASQFDEVPETCFFLQKITTKINRKQACFSLLWMDIMVKNHYIDIGGVWSCWDSSNCFTCKWLGILHW